MNRRTFFLSLFGLAGCTRSSRATLNVYNWSDYVAEDTISNFESEFSARVRYGVFESNEEMLAKILSGNSGWDVVFPSNYLIEPMRENRLLAPLKRDWLPNLANLDARYQAPAWDPNLQWSVPYMTGASGIVFNESVEPAPSAWSDLWNPKLAGRMTMLDDPAEVIGATLIKLGHPLNSTDPAHLAEARRDAIQQKKLLQAYLNAEVRDQLVAGDVVAAQLWATTSQQAISASSKLRFVYPREGFAVYADTAVILRESGNAELAHKFINYLLRADVSAAVVKETKTATPNRAALALLPPELNANPTLYPPPAVLARGQWFEPLPAAGQRLRDRIWTEIKSA